MALNISRNHDELLGAWNEVVNDKSPINWYDVCTVQDMLGAMLAMP